MLAGAIRQMTIITGKVMHARLFVISLLCLLPIALPLAAQSQDKTPTEIGGFRLGTSIDQYELISFASYLKQVVLDDVGEYRRGIIEYGVCHRPGEIVRIKLKYADASYSFYKQLFKRYKKKFGEPDQYSGDPFGILKAWKWKFEDEEGELVTVKLQYNKKDPNESLGSVVKLSMPGRIEDERLCFLKMCEMREEGEKKPVERDWDLLVPR